MKLSTKKGEKPVARKAHRGRDLSFNKRKKRIPGRNARRKGGGQERRFLRKKGDVVK